MQPNTTPTPTNQTPPQAVPAPQNNGTPRPIPQRQTAVNPNSTQNSLQIAAIRDGIVIMADGSFRSVVMAKSINFDLMSDQEQSAVEYAYQGFLNSLYFDIQVFIRSRKIDMRPYLEKLGKVRSEMDNMLLSMLMEDYIYFIEGLVDETNIMSKEFYVVVPFYGDVDAQKAVEAGKKLFDGLAGGAKKGTITIDEISLEKAKSELKNRVQSIVNGLQQMGIQAIPLDTQELIELYYNAYNPDTATRQTLKEIDQLNTPVISKGDGKAPKPNLGGDF
jgi:type IV secretory pathway VirB4 component